MLAARQRSRRRRVPRRFFRSTYGTAGWKYAFAGILVVMVFGAGSIAAAQTTVHPWSVEFGLGWDNDITGDIIAGGIGQINGQNVVMTKSTYEDVYGTGLHLKGGVGYMLHPKTELRVTLAFQSLVLPWTRSATSACRVHRLVR